MKAKYTIGSIVKIKATGEKASITGLNHGRNDYIVVIGVNGPKAHVKGWVKESELKPYCPSRAGMRNPATGRFVKMGHGKPEESDSKQRNYQKITKLNDSIHNYVSSTVLIETMLFKINEIIDELRRRA